MEKYSKFMQIPANILLFVAIAFFSVALFGQRTENEAYIGSFDTQTFNENWTILEHGTKSSVTLPTMFPDGKGTTLTLENTLPAYITDGMRLSTRTYMQDISLYIDGDLRGSYTSENVPIYNDALPKSYIMLDLNQEDAGKTITIKLTNYRKARINEIEIGYGNNAWFSVLRNNLPVVVSAFIVIVIGILSILAYIFTRRFIKSGKAVLFLGQIMFIIGFWIISESNLRQLIFTSPSYCAIFSYMFIELIGGFVALYVNEIQKYKYNKTLLSFEVIAFGQATLNTILALTGIADFHSTLIFTHFWILIGIVIAIVTVILDIRSKHIRTYFIPAIGMLLFFLFCILEIFGYYFNDFNTLGINLCIGLIILLIATVIQALLEEIEKIRLAAEQKRFQEELEKKVNEQTIELVEQQKTIKDLYIQTLTALSEAVDAKDRYTSGHSKRVAEYSRRIAERLGKTKEEQEEIYRAGLLHDVGKIRIPGEIINKDSTLTDDEYNTIKIHPVTGYHILKGISGNNQVAIGAKYHHERYDGKGYPNGLSGENIPEVARILAVADTYDAMASNRSYRKALPQDVIRQSIEESKGTQLDPQIADIMLDMIAQDTDYTMRQEDFTHKSILVVDDDSINIKLIKGIMREEPIYEIVSATSGKEALEILNQRTFDLILLDVKMPEMDGLEVLQIIREKSATPVVLMTGDKTLVSSTEFAKLGCDEYITKPFLPILIKEVIHNMTERTNIQE